MTAPDQQNRKQQEFDSESERLTSLMNSDPAAAIDAARRLSETNHNWLLLRASILCDAGTTAKDLSAVTEASQIFAKLQLLRPNDGQLAYNFANALAGCAQLDPYAGPDWYLRTADVRRRARALLGQAVTNLRGSDPRFASQVMTNLGNSLDTAHRWIEAFECFQAALQLCPENGVASGCAARALFRIASKAVLGHEPHLHDVALRLAHHAQSHRDVVAEFAGPRAVAQFQQLPSKDAPLASAELLDGVADEQRFIAEHRLILSPVLEGLGHDLRRWDDAHIDSITEGIGGGAKVPPLFAMFNVMKADYLVARDLLYRGTLETDAETGLYFDTLDYATYGVSSSRLVLAQRAALDLLDKIAVALNEHFAVGEKPKDIAFQRLWREPKSPSWRPELAKAINATNPALIALSEIAADLTAGGSKEDQPDGLLNPEKQARNAGTHRFVVLHDMNMGMDHVRPSASIEHFDLVSFQETVLRTVRLARAALLHFLEAVSFAERAAQKDGRFAAEMLVRPHHEIRGDDD